MKLKYRKSSSPAPFSKSQKLLKPIIPVSLSANNLSVRYEALIDSGADFSIFPTGIAKKLAADLPSLKKIYFSSATGEMVEGLISHVFLNIGEGNFDTKIVFADLPGNMGILGQCGFFDKFTVQFDLIRKEIEVKPRISLRIPNKAK